MNQQDELKTQSGSVQRLFDAYGPEWAARYKRKVEDVGQFDLILRAELVREMLLRTPSTGPARPRLLDIGCGTGHVLRGLSEDQFEVFGADFAHGMVKVASLEHPTRRFLAADARLLPFTTASFDVVTIIGVLEYIVEYERAVAELARVIRPGGTLVISVPNARSIFRRLHDAERALTAPIRGWRGRPSRQYHQFRWSEETATRMLEDNGFEVIDRAYCTYGVKTPALERLSPNLAFCAWASRRYKQSTAVSRGAAWTLVLHARRRTT
jgi:ubiquinone/menaquinone biosynthesis C-methylase UbiE